MGYLSLVRVLVWPSGLHNDGVANTRLLQPARVLKADGADLIVDHTGPTVLWDREWRDVPPPEARVIALAQRPDADVVVMQRPMRRWFADIIPMLQTIGVKVIVDVDDLFDSLDEKHAARKLLNPLVRAHMNSEWVMEACRRADVVTCTTPILKERYGFGHGVILPNYVPEPYLSITVPKRPATIGWTGTVDAHPKDLGVTRGAVQEVMDGSGWTFHVVGKGERVKELLKLRNEPTATGIVPFADYANTMAEIQVGIVPLTDSDFNQGKSALKMMEFASLGIPVVASATYDNVRMYEAGIGNIVKHPSHWYKRLLKVVSDQGYRDDLAGKGREVMKNYTYEKNAWRWAEVWGLK